MGDSLSVLPYLSQPYNPYPYRLGLYSSVCLSPKEVKQFYSDGKVENVELGNKRVRIKSIGETSSTYYLRIDGAQYNYQSGILYDGSDGIKRINMLFTQDKPGMFSTKTASIVVMDSKPKIVHIIYTEPLIGDYRSFVRTSFYDCRPTGG